MQAELETRAAANLFPEIAKFARILEVHRTPPDPDANRRFRAFFDSAKQAPGVGEKRHCLE
jgi:hypothetical protein